MTRLAMVRGACRCLLWLVEFEERSVLCGVSPADLAVRDCSARLGQVGRLGTARLYSIATQGQVGLRVCLRVVVDRPSSVE